MQGVFGHTSIFGEMPDWNPAEHKGKKVSVSFVMPINFHLDKKNTKK